MVAQELHEQTFGFRRTVAANRLREQAQGLVRSAEIVQRPRQIIGGVAEIRLQRERPLEPGQGLGELALHRQGDAEAVLRLGKGRVDCEPALVVRRGFSAPAPRQQHVADVEVGLGQI